MSEEKIMLYIMVTNTTIIPPEPVSREMWNEYIYSNNTKMLRMRVSRNIDEYQLKDYLCERGLISSQTEADCSSRLFFAPGFGDKFTLIANLSTTKEAITLAELGATRSSLLIIQVAEE